jgi:hypothetical protein
MMLNFRHNNITPADLHQFRDELLRPCPRSNAQVSDPIKPGEVGPNGHRVSYTKDGDKVEWIPDEDNPGEEWPLILRRSDKSILKAEQEFETVIWYDRKPMLIERLKAGKDKIDPEIEKGMYEAMRAAERKYGKRKIETIIRMTSDGACSTASFQPCVGCWETNGTIWIHEDQFR